MTIQETVERIKSQIRGEKINPKKKEPSPIVKQVAKQILEFLKENSTELYNDKTIHSLFLFRVGEFDGNNITQARALSLLGYKKQDKRVCINKERTTVYKK